MDSITNTANIESLVRIPKAGNLLKNIQSPTDLKKLSPDQLREVSDELRQFIIDIVSVHGGHFGASLGVVELTVALHYVYNSPKDSIIWDVGHQAYGHKILTGRRDQFHTNRTYQGISGFPKRSESEHDAFGVGHSSTSISAALGMAVANDLNGTDDKVVAVIGDGAMTGGQAFEALNNAGFMNKDVLVILNDNNMSIDPNVGALNEYLADITSSKTFNRVRDEIYDLLGYFKSAGETMRKIASRLESAITAAVTPGSLFRSFGFKYYGPIDGHDVDGLRKTLEDLKTVKGPKLLHVVTVKGKGFAPAEREQTKWHAQSSPFDKITGKSIATQPVKPKAPKYQDIFGEALVQLAQKNDKIVSMTPAMPSGSSLLPMMHAFPDRAFDVSIAEQHAVTFAAGLAAKGKKAFCAIYSTFLQRGFDQLVHDVAIQQLPVVFCIDRAGVVGADGPTHHGAYDVSYLRSIPNLIISSPLNEQDLRDMMFTASEFDEAAWAIRYPRGASTGMILRDGFEEIAIGKGKKIRDGEYIAIATFGPIGKYAIEVCEAYAAKGIQIAHYDMRFAKPIDSQLLNEIAVKFDHLITLEDASVLGGFGGAVAEYYATLDMESIADASTRENISFPPRLHMMGLPDRIIEHGTQRELHDEVGIGPDGLKKKIDVILALQKIPEFSS